MRVVSLLPAATEWVCALGAAGALVGRSHECDFPPAAVEGVPVVTEARFASEGDSRAIDAGVQEQLQAGLSLYDVDLERVQALRPDLILTQAQCEVCAVALPQLEAHLAAWTGAQPRLLSLEPMTLKQALNDGLTIGRALGRTEAAMEQLAAQEKRLHALRAALGLRRRADPQALPALACIEWLEPLMTAGHWMPDVAEQAGARAVLADAGVPSRTVAWSALRAADPDALALMPCGFSLEETRRDLHFLTERPGWAELTAVRNRRVFLFDGNAYFNRSGPRLYRSIELLAAAFYPERVAGIEGIAPPGPEEMQRLNEAAAA